MILKALYGNVQSRASQLFSSNRFAITTGVVSTFPIVRRHSNWPGNNVALMTHEQFGRQSYDSYGRPGVGRRYLVIRKRLRNSTETTVSGSKWAAKTGLLININETKAPKTNDRKNFAYNAEKLMMCKTSATWEGLSLWTTTSRRKSAAELEKPPQARLF